MLNNGYDHYTQVGYNVFTQVHAQVLTNYVLVQMHRIYIKRAKLRLRQFVERCGAVVKPAGGFDPSKHPSARHFIHIA